MSLPSTIDKLPSHACDCNGLNGVESLRNRHLQREMATNFELKIQHLQLFMSSTSRPEIQ